MASTRICQATRPLISLSLLTLPTLNRTLGTSSPGNARSRTTRPWRTASTHCSARRRLPSRQSPRNSWTRCRPLLPSLTVSSPSSRRSSRPCEASRWCWAQGVQLMMSYGKQIKTSLAGYYSSTLLKSDLLIGPRKLPYNFENLVISGPRLTKSWLSIATYLQLISITTST